MARRKEQTHFSSDLCQSVFHLWLAPCLAFVSFRVFRGHLFPRGHGTDRERPAGEIDAVGFEDVQDRMGGEAHGQRHADFVAVDQRRDRVA